MDRVGSYRRINQHDIMSKSPPSLLEYTRCYMYSVVAASTEGMTVTQHTRNEFESMSRALNAALPDHSRRIPAQMDHVLRCARTYGPFHVCTGGCGYPGSRA